MLKVTGGRFNNLKVVKHTDPIRFPKLVQPLENEFERNGNREINKIIIDVTKILVK
jgi:hypothetical protein